MAGGVFRVGVVVPGRGSDAPARFYALLPLVFQWAMFVFGFGNLLLHHISHMKYHLVLVVALFCSFAAFAVGAPTKVKPTKAEPRVKVEVKSAAWVASEKRSIFKADAQLNIKASYDVGEPIRVGCTCNPIDGVTITTEWIYGPGVRALDVDDLTKDVYAVPGPRKISVKLKLLRTHKLTVFVPDPAFPTDITKAKLEQIEVFDGYTESLLEGDFVQLGPIPEPPPPGPVDPPKPPDPPPSPVTTGPLRVTILEEADDRRSNKYPAQVVASYSNNDIFTYLGSFGAKPGFQIPVTWDDDYAAGQLTKAGYTTDVDQAYQQAVKDSGANTANAKEPWLTIQQADKLGTWRTVYSGQITADNAKDVMPTIQKFGGP